MRKMGMKRGRGEERRGEERRGGEKVDQIDLRMVCVCSSACLLLSSCVISGNGICSVFRI
jgi:hypothetical protein